MTDTTLHGSSLSLSLIRVIYSGNHSLLSKVSESSLLKKCVEILTINYNPDRGQLFLTKFFTFVVVRLPTKVTLEPKWVG